MKPQPSEVEAAFAGLLAAAAGADPAGIGRGTRLRADLGLDSLSLIDVAVAAEDEFGVRIPDEDLERFETVGDVVDHVHRARNAAA